MSEEAKKKFKNFDLNPVKNGYKGKREVMNAIFKEEGVTEEVVGKVFGIVKKTHHEMLDFCADEVKTAKSKVVELSLPVAAGVNIGSKVDMRKTYQTLAKKDEDGNIIEPSKPIHKYGVCTTNMSFSFTKDDKDHIASISSEVESACADFCKKQDEEAEKAAK